MVQFNLAGRVLVGVVVETRGRNTVVRVERTDFTVPTTDLRPFSRKGV